MLTLEHSPNFLSLVCKIKNQADKERIKKQISKIIENPEIGKPMRYARKGTREVYLGSFRLSYAYAGKRQNSKPKLGNTPFSASQKSARQSKRTIKLRTSAWNVMLAADFCDFKEENKLVFLDLYHKDEQ